MGRFLHATIWISLLVLATVILAQEGDRPSKSTTKQSVDESAIRANVAAFVKAYNAGDAKAVANLFSPEAQVVDEDGETTQGRDAIEQRVAGTFAESPQGKIKLDVESIRFIGKALAVETGKSTVTPGGGGTPDVSSYTVVHLKSPEGKWLMGFVRETEDTDLTPHDRLKALEWLIGDWIDESPDSVVITSCKWSDSKTFLLSDINIRVQGSNAMHLTQRIGWDPLTKQIKSWLFDSEGGYGESFWTRDGDRWLVKATAVRQDGTTATMTNIYTPTGKDSYTWQTTDRVAAGEVLPPTQIKVVRKPPEAAQSK